MSAPLMSDSSAMRILGVDPGLNITGYGVLALHAEGYRVVDAGILRSRRTDSLGQRLAEIHRGMTEVLETFKPQVVALEQIYSHYERPQTAILMGHARGVICLAASQHDLKIHSYAATNIKKILTGNGRAPKSQMQESIRRELRLDQCPEPADVADALAAALCHAYAQRHAHIREQMDGTTTTQKKRLCLAMRQSLEKNSMPEDAD